MKCPQCGKSSNVTIGSRVYCTSCGAVISGGEPEKAPETTVVQPEVVQPEQSEPAPEPTLEPPAEPTSAAPEPHPAPATSELPAEEPAAPTAPAATGPRMMDIAGPAGPKPVMPAAPTAPRAVITPITGGRTMSDVVRPAARPAAAFHNPIATPGSQASPEPLAPVTDHITVPPATLPAPAPATAVETKLATAQAIPKSESVVKFHAPVEPAVPASEPVVATVDVVPVTPAPALTPVVSEITSKPIAPPAEVATQIVASPAPAPAPEPVADPQAAVNAALAELPAPAATTHEAMQNLIDPPKSPDDPFKLAMDAATAAKPKPMAVGAAALAVVVMGGYIWLQNYPRMQLSAVAGKAGFTASLPGYLPSSYKMVGSVNAQPGQVSMKYASPGLPALSIKQQLTSWDSQSLLDNYVASHDPAYSTESAQGLTLYLFNHGEVAWVNHGIWYSMAGAGNLSRAELLKLAQSL